MTHDEMIAVMKSYADGVSVQMRAYCAPVKEWTDLPGKYFCEWDFTRFEFRIKPKEPREFTLVPPTNGNEAWLVMAGRCGTFNCGRPGAFFVREVLE